MHPLAKYLRDYFIYLSVLSLVFVPAFSTAPASCSPSPDDYVAGYMMRGEEWNAGGRVMGQIECVSVRGSLADWCDEHITVILDYYPAVYFIEAGWSKQLGEVFLYFWRYDWKNDFVPVMNAIVGHDYLIYIYRIGTSDDYRITFWDHTTNELLASVNLCNVFPYEAVDYQARVDTSTAEYDIDTSHFHNLRYKVGVRGGYVLWGTHVVIVDWPYHVEEKYDYEFYAWNTLYR